MEQSNTKPVKTNKGVLILSLVVAVIALAFFTALTMGAFKKSDAQIVSNVAQAQEFEGKNYFVIMQASLLRAAGPQSFAERLKNATSEQMVCSVSESQFNKFKGLADTKTGSLTLNNRLIQFVRLPDKTDTSSTAAIIDSEQDKLQCVNGDDGKFFFIDSLPSISERQDQRV